MLSYLFTHSRFTFLTCLRFSILLSCWEKEAELRPTFSRLVDTFKEFLGLLAGYLDLSPSQDCAFLLPAENDQSCEENAQYRSSEGDKDGINTTSDK